MRTIIIWQTTDGPVLVDKESAERIENCKQIDIAPIRVNRLVEATLHLWPEDVRGTVQHGLEPTLERVYIEFPSIVSHVNGLPDDFVIAGNPHRFLSRPCRVDEAMSLDGDDHTAETCRSKFGDPPFPRDFTLPTEDEELHP